MTEQREPTIAEIAQWAVTTLYHGMYQQGASLSAEIDRRVAAKSADYTEEHMPLAMAYKAPEPIRRYTATHVANPGLIMEFGVWRGESINLWAELFPEQTIYGFDSFEGLQEDWAGTHNAKGTFNEGGRLPEVASNVELVKGWFSDTLPSFLEAHSEPLSFLHVDCDTYPSTKFILEALADRIVPGTVILFDEYINYRGWEHNEFKAWQELKDRLNIKYEYLVFATEGKQTAVKITSVG